MWEELPSLVRLDQRLHLGVRWRVWVNLNVAELDLKLEIASADSIRWFCQLLFEPFVQPQDAWIVGSDLRSQIREHDLVVRQRVLVRRWQRIWVGVLLRYVEVRLTI